MAKITNVEASLRTTEEKITNMRNEAVFRTLYFDVEKFWVEIRRSFHDL